MRIVRLLLALLGAPAMLAAQEVGKIQGRVTDSGSGQPIAGAQVVVVGTRLGNITNADGFYFINNVPAGVQDVQAQYIGYQTVTVRQQRILAGQTLTQNFQLAQSAVKEATGHPSAKEMIKALLADQEKIVALSHKLFASAEAAKDQATADLATRRQNAHEKNAWMLRSHLE